MNRMIVALLALALSLFSVEAATLLPPGQQQFLDGNGKPYAGGAIQFFVPNTTTAKPTYKDAAQTVLNTNPVLLDAAGRATIYGSGAYRQILKDRDGNLIWDQLTADTSSAQISWGGTSTGTANAQTVTAPNFTSADGQIVGFLAGFGNTGQLTLAANGSGPIPVLRDSLSGPVNLTGGEIAAGSAVLLIYDAGRGAFHLVGGSVAATGFGAERPITAANVTDLGLIATHSVIVSGNATISSLGSSASISAPFYFLRANGTQVYQPGPSLLVAGGGPLTAYPGDTLVAIYFGDGTWQITGYQAYVGPGPAGMIAAFATASCPSGWVAGNGSAISRNNNPRLFAALGGTWGSGDGSTTFNLPDLRGYFLRGVDNGAGRDPGRAFATAQADQVGPHAHTFQVEVALTGTNAPFNNPRTDGTLPFPVNGQSPDGFETRPKNIAVLYCVKL